MTQPPEPGARHERQRLSFGPQARAYDRWRPRYPAASLRWALGTAGRRVADVGAGTGILSRALHDLGHDVVAVEPDPLMREQLAAAGPGLTVLAGAAEAVPLPAASVDAVSAGQAYHWFDPARALPEFARVLRPGGVLVAIWNVRDESVPWLAELSRIADGAGRSGSAGSRSPELGGGDDFEPAARHEVRYPVPTTADALVAMMATRSYHLTAPPDRQAALAAAVRDLVAGFPEPFDLPYRTITYRALRR